MDDISFPVFLGKTEDSNYVVNNYVSIFRNAFDAKDLNSMKALIVLRPEYLKQVIDLSCVEEEFKKINDQFVENEYFYNFFAYICHLFPNEFLSFSYNIIKNVIFDISINRISFPLFNCVFSKGIIDEQIFSSFAAKFNDKIPVLQLYNSLCALENVVDNIPDSFCLNLAPLLLEKTEKYTEIIIQYKSFKILRLIRYKITNSAFFHRIIELSSIKSDCVIGEAIGAFPNTIEPNLPYLIDISCNQSVGLSLLSYFKELSHSQIKELCQKTSIETKILKLIEDSTLNGFVYEIAGILSKCITDNPDWFSFNVFTLCPYLKMRNQPDYHEKYNEPSPKLIENDPSLSMY